MDYCGLLRITHDMYHMYIHTYTNLCIQYVYRYGWIRKIMWDMMDRYESYHCHGKTIGHYWENHGKPLGNHWNKMNNYET